MRNFEPLDQDMYLSLHSLLPKDIILFPIWKNLDDLMHLLKVLDCNDEAIKTIIADIELWTHIEKLPGILE